jgi:hypothetical protein
VGARQRYDKFPDGNLAESLARVPGIAIDRSNAQATFQFAFTDVDGAVCCTAGDVDHNDRVIET